MLFLVLDMFVFIQSSSPSCNGHCSLSSPPSLLPQTKDSTYLQRSKVNDRVHIRMLVKHLVKCLFVRDIEIVKQRPLSAYQLNAIEHFFRRVVEVVGDDNLVVGFEEGEGGKGAYIACSATFGG